MIFHFLLMKLRPLRRCEWTQLKRLMNLSKLLLWLSDDVTTHLEVLCYGVKMLLLMFVTYLIHRASRGGDSRLVVYVMLRVFLWQVLEVWLYSNSLRKKDPQIRVNRTITNGGHVELGQPFWIAAAMMLSRLRITLGTNGSRRLICCSVIFCLLSFC